MIRRYLIFFSLTFLSFIIKAQSAFTTGNITICDNESPAEVIFDLSGTSPFTFVYSINGNLQPPINTTQNIYSVFTKIEGVYKLESFSDLNGVWPTSGSAIVNVNNSPNAYIKNYSDTLSVLNPSINFYGDTTNAQNLIQIWNFNDDNTTVYDTVNDPYHTFPIDNKGLGIPNIYQPVLIVVDQNGCADTTFKQIYVRQEYWMYIPNSFTPDLDKLNDKLCIEYNAIRENTFIFKIFNKLGELLYQTTDPNELKCEFGLGWDGNHKDTGELLPMDNYIYEVFFQDFEGWKHTEYGKILLIR